MANYGYNGDFRSKRRWNDTYLPERERRISILDDIRNQSLKTKANWSCTKLLMDHKHMREEITLSDDENRMFLELNNNYARG